MKKFYITFGMAHKDTKGDSLAYCYTIVEAKDEEEARNKMFAHPLGHQWASIYESAQDAGVIKWKLNFVPFSQL